MAALTTIETALIDDASPINNDYSIGGRLKYLTTAGAYSSGTLSGNAISSGHMDAITVNTVDIPLINSTIDPSNLTTAYQATGGHYMLLATAGSVCRISSALDTGTRITITNYSTGGAAGSSGVIALDTGGAGIGLMGGTFGATGGSSANYLTLAGMQTVELLLASGKWYAVSGTGSLATFSTVLTAS